MRRCTLLFALLLTALTALTVRAQEITLEQETRLYDRPALSAKVKATLPAGVTLTKVSTQGEWTAVSTSEGLAGWIRLEDGAGGAGTNGDGSDDLLQSIRDAAEEDAPEDDPAPSTTGRSTPPPATGGSSGRSSVPPPPPPGQTVRQQDDGDGEDRPGLGGMMSSEGLYNASQWIRAAFRVAEDLQGMRLTWDRMLGSIAEVQAWLDGTKLGTSDETGGAFKQGLAAGKRPFGAGGPGAAHLLSTGAGVGYTAMGGAGVNVYALQPSNSIPVGVYVGGQGGYGQFFPEHAEDGVTTSLVQYGGGAGVYGHVPLGSNFIIPRAEATFLKHKTTVSYDEFPDFDGTANATGWALGAGVEMSLGRFVPGIMVRQDRLKGEHAEEAHSQNAIEFSLTIIP